MRSCTTVCIGEGRIYHHLTSPIKGEGLCVKPCHRVCIGEGKIHHHLTSPIKGEGLCAKLYHSLYRGRQNSPSPDLSYQGRGTLCEAMPQVCIGEGRIHHHLTSPIKGEEFRVKLYHSLYRERDFVPNDTQDRN